MLRLLARNVTLKHSSISSAGRYMLLAVPLIIGGGLVWIASNRFEPIKILAEPALIHSVDNGSLSETASVDLSPAIPQSHKQSLIWEITCLLSNQKVLFAGVTLC